MIISRTPYRISFFGGGTDYPDWYRAHGGSVLGTAIDRYCYISLRALPPFFDHRHRIVYSKIEHVNEIEEIEHPAVRAILSEMQVTQGMGISHEGDLPARSGLGSSSSFTVGLLNALYAYGGMMASKQDLAEEAIRIEQQVIRESVGSQDQIWAAFGGFNRIDFHQNGRFSVDPMILAEERREELEGSLMLFFTGFSRFASTVAKKKIENLHKREQHLNAMRAMVDDAVFVLQNNNHDINEFGELLHQSWQLKRELADGVTNPQIDEIYQAGRDAGAIGGKLLGAGAGGFMLFFVRPQDQNRVRRRLEDLINVTFGIMAGGSKIVVYEPNGLHIS
jgi:D-glycero-alpha-D-manno-heptose-7-phosphate kinase